jgi:YqjK-like protein
VSAADNKAVSRISAKVRRAELHARCEAQRNQLSAQMGEIEQRLHGTDKVLGSIRNIVTKPAVMAGGLAMLMSGGSGWWSKLSRAAVLFSTARRIYQMVKRK